jgi:hypothetical protein
MSSDPQLFYPRPVPHKRTSSHRNVRPPLHLAALGDSFIWQKCWLAQLRVMVLGEASKKRII